MESNQNRDRKGAFTRTYYPSPNSTVDGFETARRKIETDLAAVDPDAVEEIRKIQIQEWVAENAYYRTRVAYWLSSVIGILALLLTLSGIYAVVSYVITQRTKER